MHDDIILNKISTIERCLKRVSQEFDNEKNFKANFTKQDSVILNLERASQATIDIGTHIIKNKKLGIPKSSRDVFDILEDYGTISHTTSISMQSMVGFRNIAVHDYQNLSIDIVISIIKNNLDDFRLFIEDILR